MKVIFNFILFFTFFLNIISFRIFQLNNFNNKFNYEICDTNINTLNVTSLVLNPHSPEKGKELNIKLLAELYNNIHSANLLITVRYMRMKILDKTYDLCKELQNNNSPVQCPILSGNKDINYNMILPKNIPNGMYDIQFKINDQDKNQVICAKIALTISS